MTMPSIPTTDRSAATASKNKKKRTSNPPVPFGCVRYCQIGRRERIGGGDGVERGNVGLDDELGRRHRRGAVRIPDCAEAAAVARVRLDRAGPPRRRRRGAQPRRAVPPLRGRRHDGRPQIPHEGQHRPRLGRAGHCRHWARGHLPHGLHQAEERVRSAPCDSWVICRPGVPVMVPRREDHRVRSTGARCQALRRPPASALGDHGCHLAGGRLLAPLARCLRRGRPRIGGCFSLLSPVLPSSVRRERFVAARALQVHHRAGEQEAATHRNGSSQEPRAGCVGSRPERPVVAGNGINAVQQKSP